jgi:D-alanyl-D-alanine carboxypeptidase
MVCSALVCGLLMAAPQGPTLYGHRAYAIAKPSQVNSVGRYRSTKIAVKLLPPADAAFQSLRQAAQREGIGIVPISGYRGRSLQKYLFDNEVKKCGSPRRAARSTAPPGYSEHHTGLALDLGDQRHPECDVASCFGNTPAFEWLTANAARFGFELSFPRNDGPVQFEPWHWRFVGDAASRQLFRVP